MFSRMAARTSMPCSALWLTPSSGPRVWLEVGRVQTRRRALSMAGIITESFRLVWTSSQGSWSRLWWCEDGSRHGRSSSSLQGVDSLPPLHLHSLVTGGGVGTFFGEISVYIFLHYLTFSEFAQPCLLPVWKSGPKANCIFPNLFKNQNRKGSSLKDWEYIFLDSRYNLCIKIVYLKNKEI